jgi:hypothetical protein
VKLFLGIGASGALLGGLYAGDALTAGTVYDVPIEQAYGELASMPVPDALVPAAAGIDATEVDARRADGAIDWRFRVRGEEVARFTARLSPEGPGRTRVRIDYVAGEPATPELRHLTGATLTRDFARIAMREQVEAQLERRPVDRERIANALARHAADHPEQVKEYGQAIGHMTSDLYRQANENAKAVGVYDQSAVGTPGGWGPPPANQ